jgi:transcriptional regulator
MAGCCTGVTMHQRATSSGRRSSSSIGSANWSPRADWNEPKPYGVGTSFYAAVQAIGTCRFVDDPGELADLIDYQLRHLQPEGGLDPPLDAQDRPYRQMLRQIRGIELRITDVRAKFKFGGHKPAGRRREIADRLGERAQGLDPVVRDILLQDVEGH